MVQRIVIYGAGGFGREVLQLIRDINAKCATWSCVGFIVDKGFDGPTLVGGLPILGDCEWLEANPDVHVVVAVGSSAVRSRIVERVASRCRNSFAVLVHPNAVVGENVQIGAGTVVCAGVVITTDVAIAEHVHVNIGGMIGHDAVLGKFVTLNPSVNVSGNVVLHEGTEVGTGSVIIPGCVVGPWSIIGAGSVVTKPIKADCTVVGVPARVIKERLPGWQKG